MAQILRYKIFVRGINNMMGLKETEQSNTNRGKTFTMPCVSCKCGELDRGIVPARTLLQ